MWFVVVLWFLLFIVFLLFDFVIVLLLWNKVELSRKVRTSSCSTVRVVV